MGSRPSKGQASSGPRRVVEQKWRYLPQPVYVTAFGGVGDAPNRLRKPVSVVALHGLSLGMVPEDAPTAARADQAAQYVKARQAADARKARGLPAADGDVEALWLGIRDLVVAVVDHENHRVQLLDESGNMKASIGESGKAGVRLGMFTTPLGVFFDKKTQDLFVTDNDTDHIGAPRWQSFRVQLSAKADSIAIEQNKSWSNTAEEEKRALDAGDPLPRMIHPWGVAVGVKEGRILVSDNALHCIHVFSPGSPGIPTEYLGRFGVHGPGRGELRGPRGIAVDSVNNVVVADADNDRVQVFSPDGRSLGCIYGLSLPSDVAVDDRDNIIVADTNNHAIKVFAAGGGEPLAVYGGRRSFDTPGLFNFPMSVAYFVRWRDKETMKKWNHAPRTMAIDTDDDRCLVVADTGNHTVHVLTVWRADAPALEASLRAQAREERAAEQQASRERKRMAMQIKGKAKGGDRTAKTRVGKDKAAGGKR